MDTETRPSPLPPGPPNTLSPSLGPRKRSISESEDTSMLSSSQRVVTEYPGENQENRDPSIEAAKKDELSPQSGQKVSVEIPFKRYNPNKMSDHVQSSVLQTGSGPPPQQSGAGAPVTNDGSVAPAAKKRKLSPASQQAKQQEKEAKERLKNEEKQRKEEEKKKREEEKRSKEEEKKRRDAEREEEKRQREEKKKVKEEEKAAKDAAKEEEKKRREEEKLKKERAQPKLNSFFAKPKLPPASGNGSSSPGKAVKALPITDTEAEEPTSKQSDYNKAFPDFFLQSHTTVAPSHRFQRDSEALQHVRQIIDQSLDSADDVTHDRLPFRPSKAFNLIPFTRRRGRITQSVKEILRRIQSAADTTAKPGIKIETHAMSNPQQLLRKITMKSLKFGEDVRPPYQGTFTREVPAASAKKLCRNPYHQGLPGVNYEYDSEAEWEEPEEGEDLDSEEEEESDDGEDDMDGFLDDEDDALAGGKRRLIVGDLEPVCSGIRWAADGDLDDEFKSYQIQTISDAVQYPIDPFSTAYWQKPRAEAGSIKSVPPMTSKHTLDGFRVNPGSETLPPPTTKAKRPFPSELLSEFKQAVEGSDLSKIGLVEILKKKFPKVSKDTLRITLDEVAVRVGQKEIEKKWVCR